MGIHKSWNDEFASAVDDIGFVDMSQYCFWRLAVFHCREIDYFLNRTILGGVDDGTVVDYL